MPNDETTTLASPARLIPGDEERGAPQPGIALCLSGGGYRAMLFHVGSLWRLAETGKLSKIDRISSVSGGSMTAGVLGMNWKKLETASFSVSAFRTLVADPLMDLASHTIDRFSVLGGALLPGTISEWIAKALDKHLFQGRTLQDLPDTPRFVINATNVQSGALWRFSKPYMADYRVGSVLTPKVPLAVAVGASAAFPPILSPAKLELKHSDFVPGSGLDLQRPPYTTDVILSDGGVYDNLGLETAWKRYKTIWISNGGGKMNPEEEPKTDWARHAVRVLNLIDNQVRSLRLRQAVDAFKNPNDDHEGAYWGIRTDIADYELADALPCPHERTLTLAEIPTRLARLDQERQNRIVNWGYAITDAALRRYVDKTIPKPAGFPLAGDV